MNGDAPVLPAAVGTVPPGYRFDAPRVRPSLAEPMRVAPDFLAPAYVDGQSRFLRLSDFRGEWVILHFYIGDFTYV